MRMISALFLKKEKITIELDKLDMEVDESEKILDMLEELAEYRFIKLLLERLEEKDKELFMQQLHHGSAAILIEFLREKIGNVEEILRQQAKMLEAEILEDIKSLKEENND